MRPTRTTTTLAATAIAALSATACTSPATTTAARTPAHAATATARPAVPDTAAAAEAAATEYLSLAAARQWDGAWRLLDAAGQKAVPEHLWTAFHRACPPKAAAAGYTVTGAVMTGRNAVVTYATPAAAKTARTGASAMTWAAGGWRVVLQPAAEAVYAHRNLTADLAAARKAGGCAA